MPEARSLSIQSVLYGNEPKEILRAAESLANSASRGVSSGQFTGWTYRLGDCSPNPVFSADELSALAGSIAAAGGEFSYDDFDANLGSAAGHNALAASGSSELMVILNPDAIVAPDTLSALAGRCTAQVGIVEARQIPLEHPKEYSSRTGKTSWASTACAMTSRAKFDEIGGFDAKTFFLYCDDVDYSWRLRLAGYSVLYEPAARVFHDKRLTTTGDWPASDAEVYYSAEAAILLAAKYSRPDLVSALVDQFTAEGGAPARAAREFQRRADAGLLAPVLDATHQVGQFVNGNYSIHRF